MALCGGMMCGGTGGEETATEEVQNICDNVKEKVESKFDTKFTKFTAKTFKAQMVSGTNYFIKVDVGMEDDHVHICVYKKLACNVKENEEQLVLSKVQKCKKDHPIGYF